MRNLIVAIILSIAATGCITQERCMKRFPAIEGNDTHTEIVEIFRDSIVKIPADSSIIKALLKCDSLGNVYVATIDMYSPGKNIKPEIVVKNNWLTAICKVDSMKVYITYRDRYERKTEEKLKIAYKEKELSKWQIYLIETAKILLSILALVVIFYVFKNWVL